MKERSKTAARTRRENENAEFEQLAKLLPLPSNITSHLDKASVIRLTTSYLKMRKLFPSGLGEDWGAEPAATTAGSLFLKELSSHLLLSLDGFVFMLDPAGKVIYVSETASVHLGLSQIEMTGNSIYDFIHQSDFEEMRSILNPEFASQEKCFHENLEIELKFCLRMKCVLAKRNAGLAVDGYKAIHCSGYLKLRKVSDPSLDGQLEYGEVQKTGQQYQVAGLVAIGQSLPSSSITDIKMSSHTFMFRANLDFTLIYLGARITAFTGYEPQKMVDKTLYQFVHCCDSLQLQMDHRSLLLKGQVITKYYRLLTKSGEWIWIQSYCSLINSNKPFKHNCIVALNHVISGQGSPEIMDSEQALYEQLHSYEPTKPVPCSKRSQKSHQRNKLEGSFLKDAGNHLLHENNNICPIIPESFVSCQSPMQVFDDNGINSCQSPMQVVDNSGISDLHQMRSSMFEISSTRKLVPDFVSEEIIDKGEIRMTSMQSINDGPYAKNFQLVNGDFSSGLSQSTLSNYSYSSESNSPESDISTANNYSKTEVDAIACTKPLASQIDSMPENKTMNSCHFVVYSRNLKTLNANKERLFSNGIHTTETSYELANPNVSDLPFPKIVRYQSILPSEINSAVRFNERKTETEKKTSKRKIESKKDCNKLKRISASRNSSIKQQSKLGGPSSCGDSNNNYVSNTLAANAGFPENEICYVGEYTSNSCVQDLPATDLNHAENGTITGSNAQFPYFNNFLDLQRHPAVLHDHQGVMVHSTCYEMLRAASNSGCDVNSASISYSGNDCSVDSLDFNVSPCNVTYDSASFKSINSEGSEFCDRLYSNCGSSSQHHSLHEIKAALSSEASPSNMPSYLDYEVFSVASTPMSNDISTNTSSIATTSIDSDYQDFSWG